MVDFRPIPSGDGRRFNWLIPVNSKGEPKMNSRQWKEMIVSICARNPEHRTPSEVACLRKDAEQERLRHGIQCPECYGVRINKRTHAEAHSDKFRVRGMRLLV